MKVVFDEHVAPKIVAAVRETARLPVNWELVSIYNLGLASTEDETWLERYADLGERYFVSGDRKMLSRPTLLRIIQSSKLVGIFLKSEFSNQRRIRQLAYVAYWWEDMQERMLTAPVGTCWMVPNDFSISSLKAVNIDAALRGLAAGT